MKSPSALEFISAKANEYLGVNLEIKNPVLVTGLNKQLEFKADKILMTKENTPLLNLEQLDIKLDFSEALKNKLTLNKLYVDDAYIDADGLLNAFPSSEKQGMNVDIFNSLVYIKNLKAKYEYHNVKAVVDGKDLIINALDRNKRDIRFDISTKVTKDDKSINISLKDMDKVYIKDKRLVVDNVEIFFEKSKLFFNAILNQDNSYSASVGARNFKVNDVVALINSKLLDEKTSEMLAYFSDIDGSFDFKVSVVDNVIFGDVNLNRLFFKLTYMENLPVLLTQGKVFINNEKIELSDFKGIYNNKAENKLNFEGKIVDYLKSFDTNIVGNAVVTNDFATNYLSKFIAYPVEFRGKSDTRIIYKSKYNAIDMLWLYRFNKGVGIYIGGEEFGTSEPERALVSKMHIQGPILNIESMNYYIGTPTDRDFFRKPILTFYGNVDMANNCNLMNFGFKIPNYLTSRFINMLLKKEVFRRGMIKGNLEYISDNNVPKLKGNLTVDKVGIPSQRMFVRNAVLSADNDTISFSSEGKFKRSDYKVKGEMQNSLLFPIVIKDANLTLDNLDIQRFMQTANNKQPDEKIDMAKDNTETDETVQTFDTSLLVVENATLNLVKAFYKDIEVSDVFATMKFDRNQRLTVSSNRFNFARGVTSAKIVCDLKNRLYSMVLGVKDVDSNLVASTILQMKKEISGLATGFIALNTDETFKLNGKMKFNIKDGAIAKVGLFEYVLKFTSVFRNPIASISPTTVFDFVNVPEGSFDI
ncbi:hypothetical protein IJV79_03675, partial [bacterium]|nr:hypothetical protein [bacterium]